MNPKEWQKEFDEEFCNPKDMVAEDGYPVAMSEDLKDFITNLLEAIAVSCEGEKKQIPKTINVDEAFWGNPIKAMLVHEQGVNIGLTTAATLIRSIQ